MKNLARFVRIVHTLAAYRVMDLAPVRQGLNPVSALKVLSPTGAKARQCASAPEQLRRALEELGPIFIKFGQVLSTRPDMIPEAITDELARLQDDVEPFPWPQARALIEEQLGQPLDAVFSQVDEKPLASASVAQVHAATLKDGQEVIIKVLRPGIRKKIRRDVELLRALARLARKHTNPGVQVDPEEIVAEFEKTIHDELDLQREAANASLLRKNFQDSPDLYIPAVYWDYCKEKVMVMERIHAIPIRRFDLLDAAGINRQRLAEKGIKLFYTQVFRDNFFHADMHPGNIFVDPENPEDPRYIILDFGICGSLPREHKRYLANNFAAFFDQDYYRIAELHIEAGWVPPDTRLDELESAVRTVCEPYFARPISEISFGEVMLKTFQMARRFNLIVQPEFVLLQKTLLNVEGLGRQLYPQLDVWETSKPVLAGIMRDQYGIEGARKRLKERLPGWLEKATEIPDLLHETLRHNQQQHDRQNTQQAIRIAGQRKNRLTIAGGLLALTAAVLYGTAPGAGPQWHGLPVSVWAISTLAAFLLFKGLKK